MTSPCLEANFEQSSSVKVTAPLVRQIVTQSHQLPDDFLVKPLQQAVRNERAIKGAPRQDSAYQRGEKKEKSDVSNDTDR